MTSVPAEVEQAQHFEAVLAEAGARAQRAHLEAVERRNQVIEDLYCAAGWGYKRIGKAVGLSHDAVRSVLRRRGVPLRG